MVDTSPLLLGSAAEPLPRPGCRCRTCLGGTSAATSALRAGDVVLDQDGVRCGNAAPVPLAPGGALAHAGVRVIGLPGGPAGATLVLASESTGTILWAPGGSLPESTLDALAGAALDVAALAAGPDGTALARTLAQLRRAGALTPGCDVVTIEIGHGTAPERLAPRLAEWGARQAPDGAPLGPDHAGPAAGAPHRTLVLGAASSGKSALAETLLAAEPDVDYLPTGPAPSGGDADWAARVDVHRRRRPAWWRTLEDTAPATALLTPGPPLLLDSLGTWVTGALDRCGAWDDAPGWQQALDLEVDAVVQAWRQARRRVVAVGEETGWGVVPATPAGRRFRDVLGAVNRRLAAESERMLLVVAGRVVPLGDGLREAIGAGTYGE